MDEKSSQEGVMEKGITPDSLLMKQNQVKRIQKVITDLTKITRGAAKIRKNAKELVEVEEKGLKRVTEDLQRVYEALQQDTLNDAISQILANIQEIKKRMGANILKTPSWSQIVAAGTGSKPIVTAQVNRHQAAERRKDRETIISIRSEEEKAESNRKTTEAVLEAIRTKEPKKATDNIAAL